MSDDAVIELPARRAVYTEYEGPRSGFGQATRTVYSWVGTYFADRVGDVIVCFGQRPRASKAQLPTALITAEVRFAIDDVVPETAKLPEGMETKSIPPEQIVSRTFTGPLTTMEADSIPWMMKTAIKHPVLPGYRKRIAVFGKAPTDGTWEVEVQLVRDPSADQGAENA